MAILVGAALVASAAAILLTHWKQETAAHVACGAAIVFWVAAGAVQWFRTT